METIAPRVQGRSLKDCVSDGLRVLDRAFVQTAALFSRSFRRPHDLERGRGAAAAIAGAFVRCGSTLRKRARFSHLPQLLESGAQRPGGAADAGLIIQPLGLFHTPFEQLLRVGVAGELVVDVAGTAVRPGFGCFETQRRRRGARALEQPARLFQLAALQRLFPLA